jgi:uncharacterized protein RhaS with RHS repeats
MSKLLRVAKHAATKSASGPSLWLSRDPIGERGGVNLYAYVGNNPVIYVDPYGLYLSSLNSAEGLLVMAAIAGVADTVGDLVQQAVDDAGKEDCEKKGINVGAALNKGANTAAITIATGIGFNVVAAVALKPVVSVVSSEIGVTSSAYDGVSSNQLSKLTSNEAKKWVKKLSDVVPSKDDLLRLEEIAKRAVEEGKQSAINPVQSQRLQRIREALKDL